MYITDTTSGFLEREFLLEVSEEMKHRPFDWSWRFYFFSTSNYFCISFLFPILHTLWDLCRLDNITMQQLKLFFFDQLIYRKYNFGKWNIRFSSVKLQWPWYESPLCNVILCDCDLPSSYAATKWLFSEIISSVFGVILLW